MLMGQIKESEKSQSQIGDNRFLSNRIDVGNHVVCR